MVVFIRSHEEEAKDRSKIGKTLKIYKMIKKIQFWLTE